MIRALLLAFATVVVLTSSACSNSHIRSSSTATPPTPSTSSDVALEQCGSLKFGVDGTAGPIFCQDGRPNAAADSYFRRLRLRVLALGAQATPGDVNVAICDDFGDRQTTIPIEGQAVRLAEKEQGWHFGVDPADNMNATAQSCATPSPSG